MERMIIEQVSSDIINVLFEGGPGSGPRPGSGGRRMSIDRAQKLMSHLGMKMDLSAGSIKYDLVSKTTSYIVTDKHGNQTRMNAKDIIDLVNRNTKKKLKESFDSTNIVIGRTIAGKLFR